MQSTEDLIKAVRGKVLTFPKQCLLFIANKAAAAA